MVVAVIEQEPSLQVFNTDQIRPIGEWERQYPDLWLLIEVTREDIWEIYEGKLIATAQHPIEFVEIGKSLRNRGIVHLTTRGVYTKPQPVLIA